ncbi:MAG: hypothetical protein ABFC94_15090 [Syntrophomonas sp.]
MFTYVPILRYQKEEKAAFKSIDLSSKFLPLIEIIHAKGQKKTADTFVKYYTEEFTSLENPILIDIPTYMRISNSTKNNVRPFLEPIIANPTLRAAHYNQLRNLNIIPVVSYIPNVADSRIVVNHLDKEFKSLLSFDRVAFRVFKSHFNEAIATIERLIRKDDILIFDLNKEYHNSKKLIDEYYKKVAKLKKSIGCKTVLIRSVINDQLTNAELPHSIPIDEYDNSLLKDYKSLGFDAFGDFAGIKKDNLTKGGPGGTCGFVFYHWDNNEYIGFKGNTPNKLTEYSSIIVPSVLKSNYYKAFSRKHHRECPGCQIIQRAKEDPLLEKVDQFAKWKRITVMHYLHTMEEFL